MRHALIITLSLLIQISLVGRVLSMGTCCPIPSLEHLHNHGKDLDASHDHESCQTLDIAPGDHGCPADCSDPQHHHHHGKCIHAVHFTFCEEASSRLAPPLSGALQCKWQHQLPPEDPVIEQDKPPLI